MHFNNVFQVMSIKRPGKYQKHEWGKILANMEGLLAWLVPLHSISGGASYPQNSMDQSFVKHPNLFNGVPVGVAWLAGLIDIKANSASI